MIEMKKLQIEILMLLKIKIFIDVEDVEDSVEDVIIVDVKRVVVEEMVVEEMVAYQELPAPPPF